MDLPEKPLKPLIIYHGWCQDGFGAALAAWMKYGKGADYHAANHGDPPPGCMNRPVVIVDYAYKRVDMLRLKETCESLVVLDHHISAQKELGDLDFCHFTMDKSGARIAWEHFHPGAPVPELILDIEDRDLWKWQRPDSRAITCALDTYPFRFGVWSRFIKGSTKSLKRDGEAILRYQDQMLSKITHKPEFITLAGFNVPAVNCPVLSSEIGNILCQNQPFAVIWRQAHGIINYSMRSSETGEDVSRIAAAFGGGGHARAAGFSVKVGTDVSILPNLTQT
ncbi:MAG: phosphoesterase [Planctomycetota bacterium]